MHHVDSAPRRVSLRVNDEALPAIALELSGQRAAVKSLHPLPLDTEVSLLVDWGGGSSTCLPGRVRSVSRDRSGHHVALVELFGVEGDWTSFLEYLGPASLAS